jgi:beta-galactosidase GanA
VYQIRSAKIHFCASSGEDQSLHMMKIKGQAYYLAAHTEDRFLSDFYGKLSKSLSLKRAINKDSFSNGLPVSTT